MPPSASVSVPRPANGLSVPTFLSPTCPVPLSTTVSLPTRPLMVVRSPAAAPVVPSYTRVPLRLSTALAMSAVVVAVVLNV